MELLDRDRRVLTAGAIVVLVLLVVPPVVGALGFSTEPTARTSEQDTVPLRDPLVRGLPARAEPAWCTVPGPDGFDGTPHESTQRPSRR